MTKIFLFITLLATALFYAGCSGGEDNSGQKNAVDTEALNVLGVRESGMTKNVENKAEKEGQLNVKINSPVFKENKDAPQPELPKAPANPLDF